MTLSISAGFKEELRGRGNVEIFPEFGVVQDADRLDAIGAIGNQSDSLYSFIVDSSSSRLLVSFNLNSQLASCKKCQRLRDVRVFMGTTLMTLYRA